MYTNVDLRYLKSLLKKESAGRGFHRRAHRATLFHVLSDKKQGETGIKARFFPVFLKNI